MTPAHFPGVAGLIEEELARFRDTHPASAGLHDTAPASLLSGVPMQWMVHWPGSYPIYVQHAAGGHLVDVDGHDYVDFCLGDSGAMAGHSPGEVIAAATARLARGVTFMLPTADAIAAAEHLARRFGLPIWQFTLSATDANRAAIRYARGLTRRPKILIFNHSYHGGVDETFATLDHGSVVSPATSLGPPVDPAVTTNVAEFNDIGAVEGALAAGDIAAVLTEPALTNAGIVLPEPGFHAALRHLTRANGSLLILDETHTLCCGPGGYTREYQLEPDIVVVGKAIAGGLPAGAYGFTAELGAQAAEATPADNSDSPGVGGTLAANALSMAAVRATLETALTDASFARTIPLASRWADGVRRACAAHGIEWHVIQLGCRAEFQFSPAAFATGADAIAAKEPALERFLHLFALNRGVLLTPFHNMALMCPEHSEADVDRHSAVFDAALTRLSETNIG
ncbi:MAG TPA: transaminase [Streptosporangiaceae bacterium]